MSIYDLWYLIFFGVISVSLLTLVITLTVGMIIDIVTRIRRNRK